MVRLYRRQLTFAANFTVRATPNQISAANPVINQLRGFQECNSVEFFIPRNPPTTPPYSLLAYTFLPLPRAYPLDVERGRGSFQIVYGAGQSYSFMPTLHDSPC